MILALVAPAPPATPPLASEGLQAVLRAAGLTFTATRENWFGTRPTAYDTWAAAVQAGLSYMVGADGSLSWYLQAFTSQLRPWQRELYAVAKAAPALEFDVRNAGYIWTIFVRGEMVVFRLPYHDRGGEKMWISRDGQTQLLVDVD